MIVRMCGLLAEVSEETILLERDGLTYELLVPAYALAELGATRGREVTLHTLEYFEGNAAGGNLTPRLVGFPTAPDREFFKKFLTVKGIGVRKALRALKQPVAVIASFIESSNVGALSELPGIGRRMAEQIVAELRGKTMEYARSGAPGHAEARAVFSSEQRDAIEIIVAWGDSPTEAQRWVARAAELHKDLTTAEAWVKAAYRVKSGAAR
jgi:Holliday junction DNA helicase RuvA